MKKLYSPEQIVGIAKLNNIECVSAERIYQYIWEDKKKGGSLYKFLRTKDKSYRKRVDYKDSGGIIPNKVGIDKRSEVANERRRVGDLEINLVIGKNHKKAILTINDRATGMVKITLFDTKKAEEIKEKTILLLQPWKERLHTMTLDNGKEFSLHKDIAEELELDYYFARPCHKLGKRGKRKF